MAYTRWFLLLATGLIATCLPATAILTIVPRSGWHARPPTQVQIMKTPVPFVVIHHSYLPAACTTTAKCIEAMQSMQNYHQKNQSWNDIGYNFAVGGDGFVYEGRGWSAVGAHAPSYNDKSIGICLIGDWTKNLPPPQQLQAVHELIDLGIKSGRIKNDYKLVGHRQVKAGTECPGDRLFLEIRKWKHFVDTPKNDGKKADDEKMVL